MEWACSTAVSLKIRLLPSLFVGRSREPPTRLSNGYHGAGQGSAGGIQGGRCMSRHKRLSPWQGLIVMPLEDASRGRKAYVGFGQGVGEASFHERRCFHASTWKEPVS